MCRAKIEAEPGVETKCPKCGASFQLRADVKQDDFKQDENSEIAIHAKLLNEIYEHEKNKNYDKMAECAKKIIELEDEIYDGWAYLAIAESNIVSKLIDENNFNDNTKLEEIDTYFENAYEYSYDDKEIAKLRPIHSAFLKKNLIHAATLTINHLQKTVDELTLSLKGKLKEDQYAELTKDKKKYFIDKFSNVINEQKHNLNVYDTLSDEELITTAQKIMIKNKPE